MPIELKMPALSPTMEKGTLARWLVATGDMIRSGDLIAEIETDKATMELEATNDGRVSRLVIDQGTSDVPVGAIIALLDEVADGGSPAVAEAAELAPVVAQQTGAHDAAMPAVASPEVSDRLVVDTAMTSQEIPPADRVRISPLAARIAQANGIETADIIGSGAGGRIVRADLGLAPVVAAPVQAFVPVPAPARPVPSAFAPPADIPHKSVKLSSMRRTIARRLTESKQTVPHFYLTARCNIDALLKLRAQVNGSLSGQNIRISVNDMLVKAMALALAAVPEANVQFGGEEIHHFERVDIAMAVAIEGGLITPVIRNAAALSLSAIARETRTLAEKAREGRLTPEEYQGGSASISNLGMFGIDEMVPVINPPQAVILGTAAGIEQPWKVDGKIALATIMAATASFDHRAIDGAIAARFMAAFREHVEAPLLIIS